MMLRLLSSVVIAIWVFDIFQVLLLGSFWLWQLTVIGLAVFFLSRQAGFINSRAWPEEEVVV